MLRPRDHHSDEGGERDSLIALVRDTAEGLGRLIADHIKLARTELVADAKEYGREIGVLVAAGFVLAVGYALGCVAAALGLGRLIGLPLGFAAVAGLHLVAGTVAAVTAARRMRRASPLSETMTEVSRSVSALAERPLALRAARTDGAPNGGPP